MTTVPQFLGWSASVDYPLARGAGIATDAILDFRAFTKVPATGPPELLSIADIGGGTILVRVGIPVGVDAIGDDGMLVLPIEVAAAEIESVGHATASAAFDSPWVPGEGFTLAGARGVFGPGLLGMADWAPDDPVPVERSLLADLSTAGLYRLRARVLDGEGPQGVVDLCGNLSIADGYNVATIPGAALAWSQSPGLLLAVARGGGAGIHQAGWPFAEEQPDCSSVVMSVNGAGPDELGGLTFVGEGGLEIVPDYANHSITIRIGRVSQSGVKC